VNREKYLAAWSECVGRLLRFEVCELEVSVALSCGAEHIILSFPTESLESETLRRQLSSYKPGTKVALLRTDDMSRPLLVRLVGSHNRDVKNELRSI